MINYIFPPFPDFACKEQNYAYRSHAFSNEEIDKIIQIGEYTLQLEEARIKDNSNGNINKEIRNSKVSWIPYNTDTSFIYDHIAKIACELNGQFFQFDIHGFFESIQYTVYEGQSSEGDLGGHYTWHIDKGFSSNSPPRKMSVVIQLSDPSEYDGGNLQIMVGQPETLNKAKGLLYMFPSYVLHRVTPVTSGIRRTLVVWLTGPKFR